MLLLLEVSSFRILARFFRVRGAWAAFFFVFSSWIVYNAYASCRFFRLL